MLTYFSLLYLILEKTSALDNNIFKLIQTIFRKRQIRKKHNMTCCRNIVVQLLRLCFEILIAIFFKRFLKTLDFYIFYLREQLFSQPKKLHFSLSFFDANKYKV